MKLIFEGTITEIREPRTGEGQKGEWANVEFEVTELNPNNPDYPQIALFDMFKNGEYAKYAKDFKNYYPLGTNVSVEFNLKKNTYTKEGKEISFYKTSAWKVDKLEDQVQNEPFPMIDESELNNNTEDDGLPY